MRKSAPQTVHHVIAQAMTLERLQKKAVLLAQWERAIKSVLPLNLQNVVRLANYRHHRLIIEVASASWLARLRYEQSELLTALRHDILPELSGLEFVINPDLCRPFLEKHLAVTVQSSQRRLSETSAKLIENLAKECKEGLKDRLIKLAQHGKKTNNNS